MTDVVYGIVILSLIGLFIFYIRENNKEKSKLINALIAKTPEQMRDLNLADKVAPIKPYDTQIQPDVVPMESLSDEEFDKHIKEALA